MSFSRSLDSGTPTPVLVSTAPDLQHFLSLINPSTTLYIDLEGKDLSRHGTLTLITILILPAQTIHVIDVQTLGTAAFTTLSAKENTTTTLQSILEDPFIQKYLWDLRNDADALKSLFGVGLAGAIDIQLLENATRFGSKKLIRGLAPCIKYNLGLGSLEQLRWSKVKDEGKELMEKDAFSIRPLTQDALRYCAGDVVYLPGLKEAYMAKISRNWLAKVKLESAKRVVEAHSVAYQPHGEHKRSGPWGH